MTGSGFEIRFGRELRAYADELVRPWASVAIADRAIARRDSRWTGRWGPRGSRLRVALAVGLLAVVAGALLFATGGTAPLTTASPTAPPQGTAPPASRIPAELELLIRRQWGLDFAASGVSDEPMPSTDPVIALSSVLMFNPPFEGARGGFTGGTAYAGGCDVFNGVYQVEGAGIAFEFASSTTRCEYVAAAEIRRRLGDVRSFDVSPCRVPDGPLSSSLTRCIQTLQLFGAAGDLLLVYEVLL